MQQRGTIRTIIAAAIVAVAAASCHNSRGTDSLLTSADSLLRAGAADSAMSLLDSMEAQLPSFSRAAHMRFRLLQADAMNKTYRDFTTDSVMRKVADYYDHHGTPNERLRAHYLLGCTYRDLHEASLAIITWEDAVANADTLSPDCDYSTLFRVYGQMADIYFRQSMPEKELYAQRCLIKYSLLAGDTLNYIRGLLQQNSSLLALGDTMSVQRNIDNVRSLYLSYGMVHEAAQVYPTAIMLAIHQRHFDDARKLMTIFEKQSGLFDDKGNIARTWEKYYFNRGCYYLANGDLDSAECDFRRLIPITGMQTDAYYGLLNLFATAAQKDSIHKYASLFEAAMIDYIKQTKTEAIIQAEGMYDYHRNQLEATRQEQRANRIRTIFVLSVIFIVITSFVLLFRWHRYKAEKKAKIQQLLSQSIEIREDFARANTELVMLKRQLKDGEERVILLTRKEQEIELLKTRLRETEAILKSLKQVQENETLQNSDIVKRYQDYAQPRLSTYKDNLCLQPKEEEWKNLKDIIRQHLPLFYAYISETGSLTDQEFKTCLLMRLDFNTKETATILGTHESRISKVKALANFKLFGNKDATKLIENLKSI